MRVHPDDGGIKWRKVLATAVAQVLTMHPDLGAGQARRRARKVTERLKDVKEKRAEPSSQQA